MNEEQLVEFKAIGVGDNLYLSYYELTLTVEAMDEQRSYCMIFSNIFQ